MKYRETALPILAGFALPIYGIIIAVAVVTDLQDFGGSFAVWGSFVIALLEIVYVVRLIARRDFRLFKAIALALAVINAIVFSVMSIRILEHAGV